MTSRRKTRNFLRARDDAPTDAQLAEEVRESKSDNDPARNAANELWVIQEALLFGVRPAIQRCTPQK